MVLFQKKLFGISLCVTAQISIIIFLESCGGKKLLFSYLRYWWWGGGKYCHAACQVKGFKSCVCFPKPDP